MSIGGRINQGNKTPPPPPPPPPKATTRASSTAAALKAAAAHRSQDVASTSTKSSRQFSADSASQPSLLPNDLNKTSPALADAVHEASQLLEISSNLMQLGVQVASSPEPLAGQKQSATDSDSTASAGGKSADASSGAQAGQASDADSAQQAAQASQSGEAGEAADSSDTSPAGIRQQVQDTIGKLENIMASLPSSDAQAMSQGGSSDMGATGDDMSAGGQMQSTGDDMSAGGQMQSTGDDMSAGAQAQSTSDGLPATAQAQSTSDDMSTGAQAQATAQSANGDAQTQQAYSSTADTSGSAAGEAGSLSNAQMASQLFETAGQTAGLAGDILTNATSGVDSSLQGSSGVSSATGQGDHFSRQFGITNSQQDGHGNSASASGSGDQVSTSTDIGQGTKTIDGGRAKGQPGQVGGQSNAGNTAGVTNSQQDGHGNSASASGSGDQVSTSTDIGQGTKTVDGGRAKGQPGQVGGQGDAGKTADPGSAKADNRDALYQAFPGADKTSMGKSDVNFSKYGDMVKHDRAGMAKAQDALDKINKGDKPLTYAEAAQVKTLEKTFSTEANIFKKDQKNLLSQALANGNVDQVKSAQVQGVEGAEQINNFAHALNFAETSRSLNPAQGGRTSQEAQNTRKTANDLTQTASDISATNRSNNSAGFAEVVSKEYPKIYLTAEALRNGVG